VHYYDKRRKDCLNTTVLCLTLLGLLIVPIFILYNALETHPDEKAYTVSIGVIIIFMLLFSAVLSLFTKARRHEIFAAAAG
jgi:anaerobic C4-dicarboxylate transporter